MQKKRPQDSDVDEKPWYQYGMVWMIIMLPLLVVVASMVTVVIAHNNAPIIVQ